MSAALKAEGPAIAALQKADVEADRLDEALALILSQTPPRWTSTGPKASTLRSFFAGFAGRTDKVAPKFGPVGGGERPSRAARRHVIIMDLIPPGESTGSRQRAFRSPAAPSIVNWLSAAAGPRASRPSRTGPAAA